MSTATQTTELPAYIDYATAQRMYAMPRHAILSLARAGKIVLYRPGGRRALIRRADLEAVIAASADTPNESTSDASSLLAHG